jgi:glycosyltransferase involved in cell wall biosynthesis
MRRLRVVHVTGCLDVGGQEKLLVDFARHADRDRFDLRFLSLGDRGVLADEIESLGWPVTPLHIGDGLHLRLPLRIARLLRDWQTDVVHTHNDRPLLYAVPAARLARVVSVIHTKHGRAMRNTRRQQWLTSLSARLTDHFVCVSDDCARLAAEQGVPVSRVRTIDNGIDLSRFRCTGPNLAGPAVTVARLCADKDLGTLLDAVALVIRTTPEFRLWIAGDGPCRGELEQRILQLGLNDCVRMLGPVSDVPALLQQARMFALSSISEGVPIAVLEAMASGLPVAATRVGGVPDAVEDMRTGLLVAPRDPVALADALLRLHREDDEARLFGSQGRQRVEARFDVSRMVAAYEKLYVGRPRVAVHEVQGCASHI